MEFAQPRELTLAAIVFRILTAIVISGLIGVERERKNRPAGLRTYMLVTVGACVVMIINHYIYQVYHTGDPVRMGAQVISGVGFLGAGTIVVTPHNHIKGLTTAAGLWASACLGLAIGIGLYEVAWIGGVVIFAVLSVINQLDKRIRRKSKEIEVYLELNNELTIGTLLRRLRDKEFWITNLQRQMDTTMGGEISAWIFTVHSRKPMAQEELEEKLHRMDGVKFLEIL